jgi:RcsF protein
MSLVMFKTSMIMLLVIMIASCSNNYVASNLDKNKIERYFSASQVDIYKQEQDIKTRYEYISAVEGQDCQVQPHHAAPDEVNARTQARRQAFNKKANGVIFTGCTLLTPQQLSQHNNSNDAQQCHAVVICYARAFLIGSPAKQ